MSDFPPPPPPPPGPAPTGLEPIGPWLRLVARIVDGLILFIPTLIISLVIGGTGSNAFGGELGFRSFVATVLTTALTFGYYVYLESERGQTLGKQILKLKVIGPDGNHPTTEESAKRNAWLLLSILPVLGGLAQFVLVIVIAVTINSDPFKRGWHDNFAGGTAVVRAA